MIKTLVGSYSTTSKTAEIMSRYRPIAPRPEAHSGPEDEPVIMSSKIRQSPFLRNIWPLLQARPTRTRKRGRASSFAQAAFKRQRLQHPPRLLALSPPAKPFSLQGFVHQPQPQARDAHEPGVTLPLLPCMEEGVNNNNNNNIDYLKAVAGNPSPRVVPEEKDFLQQLQRPPPTPVQPVIAPQPVRPVGSVIRVERINSITTELELLSSVVMPKKKSEVEEEAEGEGVPVVITDSRNKVRMVNWAYKEMVGQPECSWLDGRLGGGRRIGGEVMLQLSDLIPDSAIGFSCRVKIEWGNEGKKKSCVNAMCDVVRVACESKDYEHAWRIRTQTRDTVFPSSSSAV